MTSVQQDRILSVFLDKHALVLKDTDVSNALVSQGIPCSADEVRRHVRLLSPGLFQLTHNDDGTITIRVDPKIEICEDFLGNHCKLEAKTCEKLHICRHFDSVCPSPNCRFPHDFEKGINRRIISKNRCEHINAKLLVRFLRFKKSSSVRNAHNRGGRGRGRGRGRGGRGRGRGRGGVTNQSHSQFIPMQKDDPNRQVDISFPSSSLAAQIDMEMIEMILNTEDINIEDRFDENENEYFRRVTIQLKRTDDLEKLLSSPIKKYQNVDIKFKRTKQIIDKTSFLLQTPIVNENDKIDPRRIELYVGTLIGNQIRSTIFDISSDSEQIVFVLCNDELDFDKIRGANKSKPQLSGKNITVIQIHEPEALEIRYNDENKPIKMDDLQTIFRPVWTNIFAYNFPSYDCAEVEFINTSVFKQWISRSVDIENRFHVTIKAIVDNVDDDHETRSTSTPQPAASNYDTRSTVSSKFDDSPRPTKIKLREDWAMIAAHPTFRVEYKEFIRKEFGGEVDVDKDEAIYNGTFPRHVDGLNSVVALGNKTGDFMRKFKSETFRNLEQNQVDILRANSATVAFSRDKGHDYLVATKFNEMPELKRKVFTRPNRGSQSEQVHPPINRQSSNPIPSTPFSRLGSTENSHVTASNTTTFMYPISTPEQLSMFSIGTFENRLRQHLQDTFNVKTMFERPSNETTKGARNRSNIKVNGQIKDVENASDDLHNLFSSLNTKKFDDKNDGNWTKIEEATQIIQHHCDLNNLICACHQTSPTTVSVHYFDINNPHFGTDEQRIEDLIKNQFLTATIANETSVSAKLTKDWAALEESIRKRNDYKQNICLYKESNTIYLYGLPDLVKDFRQKFQQLKSKHDPQSCPITLSDRQLNYLKYVAKADMNKLEKQYKSDGCDVSLARIRQSGDFLAPPDMHSRIKDSLQALAQTRETTFEINEPGFEILVSKEPERLNNLVKSKCYLEKNVDTHRISIPVPKTHVADVEDGVKQTRSNGATASATPSATSVNINHSTVTIAIGDLSTQAVDAIVACSSSGVLCRIIIEKAGAQVLKEFEQLVASSNFPGTTSGGALPCKKILFVPWSPASQNENHVKASLNSFITLAFDAAISQGCKSLAFPAVGCGGLNFDPSTIAKYMLLETRKQLVTIKTKMIISFILLANQQNAYDAFVKHLNEMETVNPMVSAKIPTKKIDDQSTIPYDQKIIRITLTSSNDNHLMKCKQEIIEFARSYSTKSCLTNKQDMLDWSQATINKYYQYCLNQRVIPTLDFSKVTVELVGAKDAVHEAEKYYYELTNETLKQARIQAVSRGVIWSVELTSNPETWEQYSFKLNGIIEDAFSKKHSHVDFDNDKEERCRIDFSKMEENTELRTRRIRRTQVDSTLPNTWEPSDQNCKRVKLQSTSIEYQNVVAQFNITMKGKYTQVINIERIQNERWYKQYAAHREDFRRRPQPLDERLLFHGCPITSADQIIQACFNRSFAGINGVVYGCGVYFHAQASYSHQYAQPNASGEKAMFLARVLIGKTCKGDKSMKVVPPGYDTTTDGQHIFVVYHDAGAYADHLITYK